VAQRLIDAQQQQVSKARCHGIIAWMVTYPEQFA
jgi:hypothetical protein